MTERKSRREQEEREEIGKGAEEVFAVPATKGEGSWLRGWCTEWKESIKDVGEGLEKYEGRPGNGGNTTHSREEDRSSSANLERVKCGIREGRLLRRGHLLTGPFQSWEIIISFCSVLSIATGLGPQTSPPAISSLAPAIEVKHALSLLLERDSTAVAALLLPSCLAHTRSSQKAPAYRLRYHRRACAFNSPSLPLIHT